MHGSSNPWDTVDIGRFSLIKGVISLAEQCFWYPLSLLKTQQQVMQTRAAMDRAVSGGATAAPLHESTLMHIVSLLKRSGVRGLYRGFLWGACPSVPGDILYYTVYNVAKSSLLKRRDKSTAATQTDGDMWVRSFVIPGVAGVAADAVCLTFWLPFDIVAQHMMIQELPATHKTHQPIGPSSQSNSWQVIKHIYSQQGLRGFFRGWGVAAAVYTPFSAVWWSCYETSKDVLSHLTWPAAAVHLASGLVAGAMAAFVTQPVDVLKTRVQTAMPIPPCHEPGRHADVLMEHKGREAMSKGSGPNGDSPGMLAHGRYLLKAEGMRGFFRGVVPRVCMTAPSSALSLFLYEYTLQLAQNR
ncbi:unnamed protein product [Vitrella brassicaformis CCMP3155]|uniref:Mitochondrial carrier protein n=2 Tax=Vitrella brassicaformis TaxID=1169539 RepID=A0A0G4FE32_VITBC|nr:unnamed protein product [Vitrella brassicaformis CCMP3155]|mmetsp:Transcript_1300/g.3377  ORF Transcript_1300/g.3377 Transcript_1300/m.3377 type:complete len:356 (+) Transcript_1300:72-1139(+)|eukprot:CEM11130.1 unnamed protein product [Vitrella brassicaformis CCMP3155]